MRVIIAASLVALTLAGCGKREALQPAAGKTMPQKPAFATATPTVDELLTPSQEARPARTEELLRRSEEREDDRFNLPPPG